MRVTVVEGKVGFVRCWFPLTEFPRSLLKGLADNESTPSVEEDARRLIEADFPEAKAVAFVKSVCRWGGYPGVGGRVVKHNSPRAIVSAISRAHKATLASSVGEALKAMIELKGLGVSFASKHLKFIDPSRHVVLDQIISSRLGYPLDVDGYCQFVTDCQSVLDLLSEAKIPLPIEGRSAWRIADVEMAIYQQLRASA